MGRTFFIYHLIAIISCAAAARFLYRKKEHRSVIRTLSLGIVLLFGLTLVGIFFPVDGFARVQLLAWDVFLYFPIFLLMGISYSWDHNRRLSVGLLVLLIAILLIAVDSFLIEPHWLNTTRLEIKSSKIKEPLTIAVLADIQTDSPGSYEIKALEIVKASNPDLILLAGDYIQRMDPEAYERESEVLNQIFREADLTAKLGIYAVRGNVDWDVWSDIFRNVGVTTIEETETFDLGPVILTGLDWMESIDPSLQVSGVEKFHLVLGHSPNFSLGEVEGDLMLAGHTHGGQVQLPGIGPLLTLSEIPRSWASGLTEIEPGKFLLVSNGIGLERGNAPRMRFLCRPEIILLQLQPTP